MRQRLRSAGVRPINNIVDITNYVMVEYGQPMHALGLPHMSRAAEIVVRRAGEDKTLTTLDGNVRALQPDMLVIADETKPVGLAGIMGGENSEIVDGHGGRGLSSPPTSSVAPSVRRRWRLACARTRPRSLKRTSTQC
ncbi:MAG: phenylalanine--tRNA ligase beta subunit-related protein [Oscillospiraceae bacterium]